MGGRAPALAGSLWPDARGATSAREVLFQRYSLHRASSFKSLRSGVVCDHTDSPRSSSQSKFPNSITSERYTFLVSNVSISLTYCCSLFVSTATSASCKTQAFIALEQHGATVRTLSRTGGNSRAWPLRLRTVGILFSKKS